MEGALSEARGDQEAATEEKEAEADLVGRLCKKRNVLPKAKS